MNINEMTYNELLEEKLSAEVWEDYKNGLAIYEKEKGNSRKSAYQYAIELQETLKENMNPENFKEYQSTKRKIKKEKDKYDETKKLKEEIKKLKEEVKELQKFKEFATECIKIRDENIKTLKSNIESDLFLEEHMLDIYSPEDFIEFRKVEIKESKKHYGFEWNIENMSKEERIEFFGDLCEE